MKSKSRPSDAKRKAKRRRPTSRQSSELIARGLEHHRAGRLVEAERCYRAAFERSPRLPEAAHLVGRVLYDLQKPEEALPWLNKAVALGPSRANALNDLGNLLQELGRPQEAEDAYRRVLELEPGNADAHSNLGTVLKERGQFDEAIDAYRRAVESDSRHFGELEPVLTAVRSSLRPGGRFVFTLERMETPPDDNVGYRLNRHGRYTHSPDYVDGCLSKCGMRLLRSKSVDLREQAGRPVGGLLVTAARS